MFENNCDLHTKNTKFKLKLRYKLTQAVILLACIQEVPGSCSAGTYDSFFVVFYNLSREIPGLYLKLGHDHFLPHPLQLLFIIIQSFSVVYSELLTAV
jgi:hypothetical protein